MKKNLSELFDLQNEFDQKNTEINSGFEMTRHTTLHIAKLLGKISEYCETREHSNPEKYSDQNRVKNEVIPDLLVYALQLSRVFDVDLEEQYLKRIKQNQGKINFIKDHDALNA